jgi:2-C-methyl-D-erythritol 2,4-cyclodiphosphate synthase
MIKNIASICEIDESQVNLKATTTEKLGFIGREEGMAAEAVTIIHVKKGD